MNKFLKKMLATSATMLVLGQLAPAFSTSLYDAFGKDGADDTARNAKKADLLTHLGEFQKEVRSAKPPEAVIKTYEDAEKAFNAKVAELATLEGELEPLKTTLADLTARLDALKETDAFKVDPSKEAPIVDGSIQLKAELDQLRKDNELLSKKAKLFEDHASTLDLDEVEKAFIGAGFKAEDVKPGWTKGFITSTDLETLDKFTEAEKTYLTDIKNAEDRFDEDTEARRLHQEAHAKALADAAQLEADIRTAQTAVTDKEDEIRTTAGEKAAQEHILTANEADYKKAIAALHDYVADTAALIQEDEANYQTLLGDFITQNKNLLSTQEEFKKLERKFDYLKTTSTENAASVQAYLSLLSEVSGYNKMKISLAYQEGKLEDVKNVIAAKFSTGIASVSVSSDESEEMNELKQQLAAAKKETQKALEKAEKRKQAKAQAKQKVEEANQSLSVIEQLANFLNSNEEVKNEVLGHNADLTELLKKALNIKAVDVSNFGLSPWGAKSTDEESFSSDDESSSSERKNEAEELLLPSEYAGNFYIGSDRRVYQNSISANPRVILKMKEELRNLNFTVAD